MQLEAFLEEPSRRNPWKTALVCGGERLSYGEIEVRCNRLAHGLLREGVKRGDRVAVYLENSVEAVLSIFAILKAGGVFMMINPTTKAEKLGYLLNNSRAAALITHGEKLSVLRGCPDPLPCLRSVIAARADGPPDIGGVRPIPLENLLAPGLPETPPPKKAIDIDLAALIYTSGSTGNPKGVMLTHRNMTAAAESITHYLENTPEDIVLNVLPLAFDYGLYQVLMGFKTGGTVILERSFTYPHAVLESLVRERATGLPIVPTMSAILLQMDLPKYDLASLRYLTNTGAALPTHHIFKLRELLPHVRIYSMYGLTECKRVSYLPPDQIDRRPASIGRGMPNTEVYLVDERGERVGPGVAGEGELVVRGAHVMKGYWEMPEETDRMLKPGPLPGEKVLHTGDLFRMDEEGHLYFMGRKDDIIKSRGEKVNPKEVENVLYRLEGVAEAAAVGVPDAVLGEAMKAVVSLREGSPLTEQTILRYCRDHLEEFMVPKIMEIRAILPKTPTGKIDKKELGRTETVEEIPEVP